MRPRHTLLLSFLIATTSTLISCNKEFDSGINNTTQPYYLTLRSAMRTVAPTPQVVAIDAAGGGTFHGHSGTKFVFPANVFVGSIGEGIGGQVQVSVTEYLTKADMLFADVLQQSDGQSLISGGALLVQASQDEQPLHFNPASAIECYIPVPGPPVIGLGVFAGSWNPDSSTAWLKSSAPYDTVLFVHDPISRKDTDYLTIRDENFLKGKAHFINAARYMNDSGSVKISVLVSVPAGANKNEFQVYAVYQNTNSVIRLPYRTDGNLKWEHIDFSYRPVSFVAMGLVSGHFYAGISSVSPSNDGVYPIHILETSPVEFRALVEALP